MIEDFKKEALDDFVEDNKLKLVAEYGATSGTYLIYDGIDKGFVFHKSPDNFYSLYSVVDKSGVRISEKIKLDYQRKIIGK